MSSDSDDDFEVAAQTLKTPEQSSTSKTVACASSSSTGASSSETVVKILTTNVSIRTLLITYSQADLSVFPTRQSFGGAWALACGALKVEYFACGMEEHEDGGVYYHVAVKLNSTLRWFVASTRTELWQTSRPQVQCIQVHTSMPLNVTKTTFMVIV